MNSNAEIQAVVCIQRAFRAVLGARGLIACDHCEHGCISVHVYNGDFLCYPCLYICIDHDQASWYKEEENESCACFCEECGEECGDTIGPSRGDLCYDCEQSWREYQVRHFSLK
jgi:hypothetical protein